MEVVFVLTGVYESAEISPAILGVYTDEALLMKARENALKSGLYDYVETEPSFLDEPDQVFPPAGMPAPARIKPERVIKPISVVATRS